MRLIYIGDEFYYKSGGEMSSLYDIYGNRQDREKVYLALKNGEEIHIRPPTQNELCCFREKLVEIALHEGRGNNVQHISFGNSKDSNDHVDGAFMAVLKVLFLKR